MLSTFVERYVAEQVEEEIVIKCAIASELCHRLGILLNHFVVKKIVAGRHAGESAVPGRLEETDLAVEFMFVGRDIEVAPADTDAIRHAPEVGGHVGKVGEAEPSPHKFAK